MSVRARSQDRSDTGNIIQSAADCDGDNTHSDSEQRHELWAPVHYRILGVIRNTNSLKAKISSFMKILGLYVQSDK